MYIQQAAARRVQRRTPPVRRRRSSRSSRRRIEEQPVRDEPQQDAHDRAGRQPAEAPRLDVGREGVHDRVDRDRRDKRDGPAKVVQTSAAADPRPIFPNRSAATWPPRKTDTRATIASTMTTTVQTRVRSLRLHEAAVVLDAVDDVQRPAGGAEGAGRAVERDEDADDEREGDRAARLGDRALQRRLDRGSPTRRRRCRARSSPASVMRLWVPTSPRKSPSPAARGIATSSCSTSATPRGRSSRAPKALERPLQDAGQRRALAGLPSSGGICFGVGRHAGWFPALSRVSVGVAAPGAADAPRRPPRRRPRPCGPGCARGRAASRRRRGRRRRGAP